MTLGARDEQIGIAESISIVHNLNHRKGAVRLTQTAELDVLVETDKIDCHFVYSP